MNRRVLTVLISMVSLFTGRVWGEAPPVFAIERPTMVAFFATESPGAEHAGENEALSDFQFYLKEGTPALNRMGVVVKVVYAPSFKVRLKAETRIFRPGKIKVGYYFIAPGKRPRVVYGVQTDDDLLQIAREYRGNGAKLQGAVR